MEYILVYYEILSELIIVQWYSRRYEAYVDSDHWVNMVTYDASIILLKIRKTLLDGE